MPERSDTRFWIGRTVLVTGAAGFIGSHLIEALVRAGAEARAFVRYNSRNDYGWLEQVDTAVLDEIEVFRGDLANPEAVRDAVAGRDTVFHLGALVPIPYSYRHPREYVAANVEGTLNILEAARRADARRVVHTSTSEVYGTAQAVPIGEEHPLRPQSPYAATKVGADQLALAYKRSFGTPIVVVRPFNTFGPRQSSRAVIPTIITQALTKPEIHLGSTTPTRDFTFVDDIVDGFLRGAEEPGIEGEIINLGSGREIAIGELAQRIIRLLQLEASICTSVERFRPPESEVERLVAGCAKAKRLLDWEPRVSLDDGLERTIRWMTESLASYKPAIYNV